VVNIETETHLTNKTIQNFVLGMLLASFLVGVPIGASAHPAIEIVDLIWEYLGGRENYAKCRYLEFTFASEQDGDIRYSRKHTWDRYEGNYVVEFKDRKTDDDYKVYFNVDTKRGVAFQNGSAVDEARNAELIEKGYALFINDTYWLLMPTKLNDPGAKVQFVGHAGEVEAHGSEGEFVVLHLWFKKGAGLTPGDNYWIYVTHDGAIVRWRYELEGGTKGDWEWKDEKDCGMGIILSTRKESEDGARAIVFPEVKFSETLDSSVFEPPPGS